MNLSDDRIDRMRKFLADNMPKVSNRMAAYPSRPVQSSDGSYYQDRPSPPDDSVYNIFVLTDNTNIGIGGATRTRSIEIVVPSLANFVGDESTWDNRIRESLVRGGFPIDSPNCFMRNIHIDTRNSERLVYRMDVVEEYNTNYFPSGSSPAMRITPPVWEKGSDPVGDVRSAVNKAIKEAAGKMLPKPPAKKKTPLLQDKPKRKIIFK